MWARADQTESDLGYGIVEQLLRGVDDGLLDRYPLLTGDIATSSSVGIGGQLLGVVGDVQADGPVVIVIDDVQWADRRSIEALSFMFRRLSVDPILVVVMVRGERDHLDDVARRMLISIEQRLRLPMSGLRLDDVAPLAAALGAERLDAVTIERLYDSTGGHTLYLQTLLSDPDSWERLGRRASSSARIAGNGHRRSAGRPVGRIPFSPGHACRGQRSGAAGARGGRRRE